MKLENNHYINEKFIDAIIGLEDSANVGIITNFKILFNNDTIPVKQEDFKDKKFCGVPGYRLINTIPEQSEISLKVSDEELIHFEFEKKVRYYLNLDNVVRIEMFQNNIWIIQMVEDIYWFSSIPSNFKTHFLNQIDQ
jgi:hypothetical protein